MKYCLLLLFMLFCSCHKKDTLLERLQGDPDFINYFKLTKNFVKATKKDEWGLKNEKTKHEIADAKQNKTFVQLAKKLVNNKGVSLYSAEMEILKSHHILRVKYHLQNKDSLTQFKQAFKDYYFAAHKSTAR